MQAVGLWVTLEMDDRRPILVLWGAQQADQLRARDAVDLNEALEPVASEEAQVSWAAWSMPAQWGSHGKTLGRTPPDATLTEVGSRGFDRVRDEPGVEKLLARRLGALAAHQERRRRRCNRDAPWVLGVRRPIRLRKLEGRQVEAGFVTAREAWGVYSNRKWLTKDQERRTS
jgi:hypothetical protein